MGKDEEEASWRAMTAFAKNPTSTADPREPWEVHTVKPKQKQTRKRRMTLSRALKQADRAGIKVGSATVKTDGVVLELGDQNDPQIDDEPNEWDVVLKKGAIQ